ncbi:MAG TPA: hypothetical protein VGX03_02785 [Candidatus Binatia bacterium]|jgi:hypothetical protein|nr:hypothetical protein [Candidatus Binatia bacterium]
MRGRDILIRLLLLAGTTDVPWARPAFAIPVFARIYDKPCGTCHTVYPQLNPAGEDFRAHGLHGLTPVVKPLRVGSLFEVPGTLPLAISFGVGEDLSKVDTPGRSNPTHTHFNFEFLSLLAGGELGRHLSFLADYAPVITNPQTGEILINTRLGLGFVQAHAEYWGWLANLKVGLFELPLVASPRVHRLSVQPYLVYGLSAFSLLGRPPPVRGARKDTLSLGATQIGVELSGLRPASGLRWVLGVTNGSNNRWDNNVSKDFYLRLSQAYGLHKAGFFLYYSPDLLGPGKQDQALRLGPDFSLYSRRFQVLGQFLAGYDSNPTARGQDLWYYGAFLEGNYRFTPAVMSLLRAEYAWTPRFDDTAQGGHTQVRRQLWLVTGGGQWLLLENLKLVAEVTYSENHEGVSARTVKSWSCTVRLVTAFWPLTPPGLSEWLNRRRGR